MISRIRVLISRHVPRGGFRHQLMLLSGGTAVGQGLAAISTPIWTRLYSPQETGLFAVFMSCAIFAGAAVTLRYELAIPSAVKDSEADALLLLAMAVSLPSSVMLSAIIYVLIRVNVLSLGELPGWAALALLPTLMACGVFYSLRYWFVRRKGFGTIGAALVAQGSVRSALPVVLGLCRMNWAGLMLGEMAARFAGVWNMLRSAVPHLKQCWKDDGYEQIMQVARKYRDFPKLLLPSAVLGPLVYTLPVPMLAHYYGAAAAGIFFIAQRLITLPVSFLTVSVADVFHGRVAAAARQSSEELRTIVTRTMIHLGQLGLLVFVPAAALAPILCGRVLGNDYVQAGIVVTLLSPWCFAELVTSPVSRLLLVIGRNDLLLLNDIVALGTVMGGIYLAHAQGLKFLQAICVAASLRTLAYVVYGLVLIRIAHSSRRTVGAAAVFSPKDA
jgi:O-antigen/teichoic acid export membrane protein